MYAHTLKDLRVPDEGRDAGFPWYEVWKAKKCTSWYGQSEMPHRFYHLLRAYVAHHLAHGEEVPDWAIGANAWFNGIAPPWQPKQRDFDLAYDIEQLRIKRGGKLPPNVYPLSRFMRNMLRDLANGPCAGPSGEEPESEHPQVEPWSDGEGQSEPAAAPQSEPPSEPRSEPQSEPAAAPKAPKPPVPSQPPPPTYPPPPLGDPPPNQRRPPFVPPKTPFWGWDPKRQWDQDPRRSPVGMCWSKPRPSGAPNVGSLDDLD